MEIIKQVVSFTKSLWFIDWGPPPHPYNWLKCYLLINESLPGDRKWYLLMECLKAKRKLQFMVQLHLGMYFKTSQLRRSLICLSLIVSQCFKACWLLEDAAMTVSIFLCRWQNGNLENTGFSLIYCLYIHIYV